MYMSCLSYFVNNEHPINNNNGEHLSTFCVQKTGLSTMPVLYH